MFIRWGRVHFKPQEFFVGCLGLFFILFVVIPALISNLVEKIWDKLF